MKQPSLAKKLTAGSIAPLITHLVEEKKLSRDDIKRIRRLLDEHVGRGSSREVGRRPRKGA